MITLTLIALLTTTPDGLPPKVDPAPAQSASLPRTPAGVATIAPVAASPVKSTTEPLVSPAPLPPAGEAVVSVRTPPAASLPSATRPGECLCVRCDCDPCSCNYARNGRGEKVAIVDDNPSPSKEDLYASGMPCRFCGYRYTVSALGGNPCPKCHWVPPDKVAPRSLHRLADSSRQVWTSPDPAWIRIWVAQENTRLAAQRRPAPVTYAAPAYAGSCATGQCPNAAYTYQRGFFGFRGR